MSAAGKKNRLKMKYPMKLWPLRPVTRADQPAERFHPVEAMPLHATRWMVKA